MIFSRRRSFQGGREDSVDRESRLLAKEVLDAQNQHWESTFSQHPDMYGLRPSEPARKAAEMFKREGMGLFT